MAQSFRLAGSRDFGRNSTEVCVLLTSKSVVAVVAATAVAVAVAGVVAVAVIVVVLVVVVVAVVVVVGVAVLLLLLLLLIVLLLLHHGRQAEKSSTNFSMLVDSGGAPVLQ